MVQSFKSEIITTPQHGTPSINRAHRSKVLSIVEFTRVDPGLKRPDGVSTSLLPLPKLSPNTGGVRLRGFEGVPGNDGVRSPGVPLSGPAFKMESTSARTS